MSSPDRITMKPRVLTYDDSPDNELELSIEEQSSYHTNQLNQSPRKQPTCSPPYRKVRALRLFDTPSTPKTILQISDLGKNANHHEDIKKNAKIIADFKLHLFPTIEKPTAVHVHGNNSNLLNATQYPTANVNPFTPDSLCMRNKKRSRIEDTVKTISNKDEPSQNMIRRAAVSSIFSDCLDTSFCMDDDLNEMHQAPKRLALQDTNISRYKKEFVELARIGVGEFGFVYKCVNRLDGCVYAIKKSIKPIAGSVFEKTALNEVWAHAVLGKHDNVVRYYSAWTEDNHMLIQNEYCNGGSLQQIIQKRFLDESELHTLLTHIASGLKYIHSNDLVHMDLKAGNIFMNKVLARNTPTDSCDDGYSEEDTPVDYIVTYKIGDLGHVTSVNYPQVEEGDCRYLPNEILQQDYSDLFKADIFSLGITLYEAAGGGPLPKNGDDWHALRNGKISDLPNLSRKFNDLIKLMTHPNHHKRPSSTTIFHHSVFCPNTSKSKAQIAHELQMEKQKNEWLMQKLKETTSLLESYEMANTPNCKRALNLVASDRKLRSFSKKKKTLQRTIDLRRRSSLHDKNLFSDVYR